MRRRFPTIPALLLGGLLLPHIAAFGSVWLYRHQISDKEFYVSGELAAWQGTTIMLTLATGAVGLALIVGAMWKLSERWRISPLAMLAAGSILALANVLVAFFVLAWGYVYWNGRFP